MDIPLAKQEELFERYKQTERAKHLDAIAEEANRAAEKASKEADLTHDAEDAVFWAAHDLAMELNQVAIHAALDFINDWQVYLVDTYLAELGMEQSQAESASEEAHKEDMRQEEESEQCALGSDSGLEESHKEDMRQEEETEAYASESNSIRNIPPTSSFPLPDCPEVDSLLAPASNESSLEGLRGGHQSTSQIQANTSGLRDFDSRPLSRAGLEAQPNRCCGTSQDSGSSSVEHDSGLEESHKEEKRQEEESEQCALGSDSGSVPISELHAPLPDCPEVRECPQARQRLQRSEARSARGCGVNTPPCVVQAVEPLETEAQSRGGHQPSKVIGPTRGLRSPALSLLLLLLAFVASWFGDSKPSEAELESNNSVVNPHSVKQSFEGARPRSQEKPALRGDCQPAPN